jgi:hypothetical protein
MLGSERTIFFCFSKYPITLPYFGKESQLPVNRKLRRPQNEHGSGSKKANLCACQESNSDCPPSTE